MKITYNKPIEHRTNGIFQYYEIRVNIFYLNRFYFKSETNKSFYDKNLKKAQEQAKQYCLQIQNNEEKIVEKYNSEKNYKINNIFDKNLLKQETTVNWEYEKQKKHIPYRKFSTQFIVYDDIGYPIKYFCLNDKEYTKKPTKPIHPNWTLSFLLPENKIKKRYYDFHQKMKEYEENKNRYNIFLQEQQEWRKTYSSYIEDIKQKYNKLKEKEIEIYCHLVLINLEFNIKFIENFSLKYNEKDKILRLDYLLPSKKEEDIKNLLIGYFKNQNNEYEMMFYHKREYNRRLNHIWNQIIYIIIYKLYQADKVNAIDKIYFNGKINSNESYIELIINKDKFNKYKLNSYEEFFDKFNKDLVYIESLVNEGIYVAEYNQVLNYQKDNYYNLFNDRIIELCIQEEGDLSSNNIHLLTKFNKLERLIIKNQNLDAIPTEIFSMTSLESINFQSNKIKKIPQEIEKLIKLKRMDFSNNQITEFPSFILNLKFLQSLLLTNNFIKNIDIEILKKISSSSLLKLNLEQNPIMNNIKKDKEFDEPKRIVAKLIAKEKRLKKNQEITHQKEEKVLNKVNLINIDFKKPLIITEGKTDWKHLKKALERFQKKGFYQDLDIQFEEYENPLGDGELDRMVQTYCKTKQSRKHIFIFDRDNNSYIKKYAKQEFNNHGNNVYSFCIPKISEELDRICIEFYYKKNDLITKDKDGKRIFLGEEFYPNGNSKCGQYVSEKRKAKELDILDSNKKVYLRDDIEWKNNIALSKNDFTNNIINDVKGFDNFDIENFKLIFDVIEKIVKD